MELGAEKSNCETVRASTRIGASRIFFQKRMSSGSTFERAQTEEKLLDAELRLRKSLQQILVIDAQIRELEILYKRAQKSKKNASRYNLRLKLSVVSGKKSII